MLGRLGVEVIQHHWRSLDDRLHIRVFTVEDPQRILLEAANTIVIKRAFHAFEVVDQGLAMTRP